MSGGSYCEDDQNLLFKDYGERDKVISRTHFCYPRPGKEKSFRNTVHKMIQNVQKKLLVSVKENIQIEIRTTKIILFMFKLVPFNF